MTATRKQLLGPYEIIASIGAGGMGEVFRARDARLNREVAIKVLPKDFASDPDRLRPFEQESRTVAALNHANILTIYDTGVYEGTPYLVSELLEGETLREEMNPDGSALPTCDGQLGRDRQGVGRGYRSGTARAYWSPESRLVGIVLS